MESPIDFYIVLRLKSGRVDGLARVSMDDAAYLSRWRWYRSAFGYACRTDGTRALFMHRVIAGTPKGRFTDHMNRDRLDNRRSNLRVATQAQNQFNRDAVHGSRSKFKGVDFMPKKGKWRARISDGKDRSFLGLFQTELEAAAAYDVASVAAHGAFASLNLR